MDTIEIEFDEKLYSLNIENNDFSGFDDNGCGENSHEITDNIEVEV